MVVLASWQLTPFFGPVLNIFYWSSLLFWSLILKICFLYLWSLCGLIPWRLLVGRYRILMIIGRWCVWPWTVLPMSWDNYPWWQLVVSISKSLLSQNLARWSWGKSWKKHSPGWYFFLHFILPWDHCYWVLWKQGWGVYHMELGISSSIISYHFTEMLSLSLWIVLACNSHPIQWPWFFLFMSEKSWRTASPSYL